MTRRFLFLFLCLALAGSWFAVSAAAATEEKPKEKDATFDLKEASIFDNGNVGQSLWRAISVQCATEPFKEVKAYPKLNSKRPLYGKLQFPGVTPGKEAAPIYFVLDESGEQPAAKEKTGEEKAAEEKKEEQSAEKKDTKPAAKKKAVRVPAAVKLSSYDRLYIDTNRDGDLTNDLMVTPMKNPPWNLIPAGAMGRLVVMAEGRRQRVAVEKERMAFEPVAINVDYGPGVGVRPFKIFSWFTLNEDEKAPTLRFAAATARKGTISIGKVEYEALMTQDVLTGRFDAPTTSVQLTSKNTSKGSSAVRMPIRRESETLLTLRHRGDDFYTLVANPPGDKLTVEIYRGPFGVFRVAAGDKKLDKPISFQGTFYGPKAFLNMTSSSAKPDDKKPDDKKPDDKKMAECKLPVGDYPSFYMSINYGGLQVGVSNNYYSQNRAAVAAPGDTEPRPPQGVQIREDKPFVIDFSGKPEVTFQAPPADKPIKLGADVRIATVLIDPKSDILIRGLTDPSRTKKETVKYPVGNGFREYTYNKVFSYDPTVTITNSAGKNIAEGVMPFG
jgi:hypothetical protein